MKRKPRSMRALSLVNDVREHIAGGAGYEKTEAMAVESYGLRTIEQARTLVEFLWRHEVNEHQRRVEEYVTAAEVLAHAARKAQ